MASTMSRQDTPNSGKTDESCYGHSHSAEPADHAHHQHGAALDPVCGMTVDPATAHHRIEHGGRSFYFCSDRCRTKLAQDPAKYLHGASNPKTKADVPEGTIYACPMHPQIRPVGPGNCPICGMTLEPELAAVDAGPNPELIDMTRRFWIGLAPSIPVVVLEMGGHLADAHGWIEQSLSN